MLEISKLHIDPIQGIVETHCHLGDAQFDVDRNEVIARARAAGVAQMLVIGCDTESIPVAVKIAGENTDICAVVGIHPTSGAEWSDATQALLVSLIQQHGPKIAAIGEIGLDYHWDTLPHDRQKQVFIDQIAIASEHDLPVVIHCRDAYSDLLDILKGRSFTRAVLHCFTSGHADAQRALDLGLYLGFGGVLTYPKSAELREIVASMPLDRILVETDCPYLAPQRFRGKRNEPAYITEVVRLIAELRGITPEQAAQATACNAAALFG
jgi:TatD DNase family protein